MTEWNLCVEERTVTGKQVKLLRAQGLVPGVLYGRETAPINLQCSTGELARVVKGAGATTLVTLQIGEGGEKRQALVRDVQYDVVRLTIEHIDFYQVVMTDMISAHIAVVLVGSSPVEERGEGSVLQDLTTMEVECLPGDLIPHVEVDVSQLSELGKTITVKDVQVPASITILESEDVLVARTQAVAEEEEAEEEEELGVELPDADGVEVIGQRRDDE
jgi:large subunit ribosomal protein L25